MEEKSDLLLRTVLHGTKWYFWVKTAKQDCMVQNRIFGMSGTETNYLVNNRAFLNTQEF